MSFERLLASWKDKPARFECDLYFQCPGDVEACTTLGGLMRGVLDVEHVFVPNTAANKQKMVNWQDLDVARNCLLRDHRVAQIDSFATRSSSWNDQFPTLFTSTIAAFQQINLEQL